MADNNNPIRYSDLVSPDDSITKLIAQLGQLSDAYSNTLKDIKREAITLKTSLEGVSGATESGRQVIKNASADTDKLTRAARDLAFAESENAKRLAELKLAQKEANELNKLTTRLNNSAEGSYNRLSAQYSINKIYLNNMTVEEREATEEGRKLVAETKAIYEEMKRLQEATGKTSLNVGNYEAATTKLTSQVRTLTEQMAALRLEGKQNTTEYAELSKRAGELKDAMMDATAEVKNMASDTSTLDSVLGAAAAAGGGFSAFTGAMELFGAESKDVAAAQKKLQAAIAITTGLQTLQNAVQKQSALMLGISKIQQAALTKAKIYDRLVTIQGTKATMGAVAAQKIFNAVASANPYVILALALLSVVGALTLFAINTGSAAEKQKALNKQQELYLQSLEREQGEIQKASDNRVKALERDLAVAKSQNKSLSETRKLEDKIYKEQFTNNAKLRGYRGQELEQLDQNIARRKQLLDLLEEQQGKEARGIKATRIDLNFDGKKEAYYVKDAIEAIQGAIDNLDKEIEIGVTLRDEEADISAKRKQQEAQRLQEDRAIQKQETDIVRKAEDARLALVTSSFERQRAQRQAAADRSIADIQYQLDTEVNLTVRARKALNEQIITIRKQLDVDMQAIATQQAAAELAVLRKTEDLRIALMEDGAEKQRLQLKTQYDRQIEDLTIRLQTERDLTETQITELTTQRALLQEQYNQKVIELENQLTVSQLQAAAERTQLLIDAEREGTQEQINLRIQLLQQQRQIELAQNKLLAADLRQDEAAINAKYDAQVLQQTTELNQQRALTLFDQQQKLEASEFDLIRNSEERKTRFRLQQEKDRLKKILELNKTAGVQLTDVEVQTLKNTIAKLDQEIEQSQADERGKDIYGLFGLNLDDKQKEAINESLNYALDAVNTFVDAKVQAAEASVAAADKEVDSARKVLDAELEARANGYASNVEMAQKELDLAKRNQEKALKEQRKAQKQQAAIESLQQMTSLVTATAKIWSQFGNPFVAIPLIALMWGSFAASKIKAAQMTKQSSETYGEGTVELLEGGSHQSGNDVDLGTKPDGTRRRAEGGEFFAVINKRNSRRYRKVIPDLINSLNDGTFSNKYQRAYEQNAEVTLLPETKESPDLRELKDDVRRIRQQNESRRYVDGAGNTVIVYKNLKRIIK